MTQNKTALQECIEHFTTQYWMSFPEDHPSYQNIKTMQKTLQAYADLPSKIEGLQHYGMNSEWLRKDDILNLLNQEKED